MTLLLSIVLIGGRSKLYGQATTATVQGTITDSSGAALPDARIEIRNTGTGAAVETATNAQGRYVMPNLNPGTYDLDASKAGFQTASRKGVTLNVGAEVVLDFSLQVGQQTQSVTVEGQAALVATTDATVGNLTDQRQMRELPLNGRNFEQLIQITPGVATMSGNSFLTSGFQGRAPQYSIAGSRPRGRRSSWTAKICRIIGTKGWDRLRERRWVSKRLPNSRR